MSNIIPPLLSSSPPPMLGTLDDEEDEFGDFTVAPDISYGCDVSSLPCLNQNTSVKNIDQSISSEHDVDKNLASISKTNQKDFQDKRKDTIDDPNDEITSSGESNIDQKIHPESIINNSHSNIKIGTQADNRYNTFQYLPEVPPDLVPESINDDEEFGNIDNGFLEDFDEFQCVQEVSSGDKAKKNNSVVNQINFSMQSSKGNFEPSRETDFQVSQDDRLEERNDKLVEGNMSETLDDSMYSNAETEGSYISEEFVNVNNIKIESEEKNVIESININKSEISHQLPNDDCENFEELTGNEFKPEVQISEEEQDKKEEICEANVSQKVFVVNDGCDDFGEFENHQFEINEYNVDAIQPAKQSTQTDSENGKTHDDDSSGNQEISCESEVLWASDPFGNLNGANIDIQIFEKSVQLTNSVKSEIMPKLEEKDFDDGGDYNDDDEDDDFGDFNNYSLQTRTPNKQEGKMSVIQKMCGTNSEVTIQQAESIILEMFAAVEQSFSEYCHQDFTSGDKILGQLKDVTDTCALSYQWSKSQGQNCLLKALNIDTRNILYGPRWNESMPRYAATLGFTPLEPVKSETPAQTSTELSAIPASSHIPSSESVQQNDIPSAQFDWISSGLTNPLEITPKQGEEHTIKTEDFKSNEKSAATKNLQDTDANSTNDTELAFILQSEANNTVLGLHSDSGSVKSLQLNDTHLEETATKPDSEFDDFSSFQSISRINEESSTYSSWPFNSVMLRETHISSNHSDAKSEKLGTGPDEPGWLKPTILTPDLPRKANVTEEVQTEEDDFSDFQTSYADNLNVKCETDVKGSTDNDDEFTDFQSTLPETATKYVSTNQASLQPSSAILEPLKPIMVQSVIPTSINWPDPGITDDDLIRIELNYKPHLSTNCELPVENNMGKNKNNTLYPGNSKSKGEAENTNDADDDDDWSDFISNQEPVENIQLVFKRVTNNTKLPSRTSTPELPLCIPQLNQIPLPKRAVPVITQQGLIQTKPAADHLVLPSVQQKKKTCSQMSQPQNSFQPSLISNQFVAQFGQGLTCRDTQQNRSQQSNVEQIVNSLQDFSNSSRFPTVPIPSDNVDELDDEWSDFVSSQPISAATILPSNGFHKNSPPKINFDWNRPPQYTSWLTTVTPNIITNPVSFDSFQSYPAQTQTDILKNKAHNKKNPNIVIQPRKSTIPSISSVPDLEFIAPKSRTWKK